ncbi:hypothetical protein ACIHAX_20760 [Nocardia sp. NPDC051929]|uniref:hypothetical protein n=1 Tax=Nocardia sp. NPDC051929 TaxID=3364327 RepID=UPI0037C84025
MRDMLSADHIQGVAKAAAHPLSSTADGLRSAVSTTTHADETLAKWLERHGRGSEVESTHVGDLPERKEAGRDERPLNPDTTDITTPPFSHNIAGLPGLIDQRSAELGLHTPAQRALESSLFIDEPAHQVALLSRYPRPELTFGERDWAGYLDARAFARHYGDQELTVPFMTVSGPR